MRTLIMIAALTIITAPPVVPSAFHVWAIPVVSAAVRSPAPTRHDDPTRPDPATTPGATNPAITNETMAKTLCNPRWSTSSIRPPARLTTTLKQQQMAALGYTVTNSLPRVRTKSGKGTRPNLAKCVARSANPACWEEDHLISLELGGNPTNPKNLWPQPWFGPMNAHDKDVLENRLHKMVCAGQVPLSEAQHAIATDWVAAYRRYVPAKK